MRLPDSLVAMRAQAGKMRCSAEHRGALVDLILEMLGMVISTLYRVGTDLATQTSAPTTSWTERLLINWSLAKLLPQTTCLSRCMQLPADTDLQYSDYMYPTCNAMTCLSCFSCMKTTLADPKSQGVCFSKLEVQWLSNRIYI